MTEVRKREGGGRQRERRRRKTTREKEEGGILCEELRSVCASLEETTRFPSLASVRSFPRLLYPSSASLPSLPSHADSGRTQQEDASPRRRQTSVTH
eukprot:762530-Hanusia_phi.AAC.1